MKQKIIVYWKNVLPYEMCTSLDCVLVNRITRPKFWGFRCEHPRLDEWR